MAHITRIKAGSGPDPEPSPQPQKGREAASNKKAGKDPAKDKKPLKTAKNAQKQQIVAEKPTKITEKPSKIPEKSPKTTEKAKKPFILFRPFIALGRYLKGSWQEIRQVRWPSRKATWKMFLAVIVYAVLFLVLIVLLDAFFQWLFNIILNKGV